MCLTKIYCNHCSSDIEVNEMKKGIHYVVCPALDKSSYKHREIILNKLNTWRLCKHTSSFEKSIEHAHIYASDMINVVMYTLMELEDWSNTSGEQARWNIRRRLLMNPELNQMILDCDKEILFLKQICGMITLYSFADEVIGKKIKD